MNELEIILDNISAIDDDGWALIAPYGEHLKTRVARVNGVLTEQKFLQVLDNDAASAMLSKENSLFRRIKRAVVGIPVYAGHPDLADHSPETLANKREKKIPIGVINKVRKGELGIEARFHLTPDGGIAVENQGCKFPSALWLCLANGETKNGATVVKPFKLLSVGLTAHPNISGVESLANARGAETQTQTEPDMKLLAGYLIAQGLVLANTEAPTEVQILEAIKTFHTAEAGKVVTLGNEKSTLAGQITKLETDLTAEKGKVATLENSRTDLSGKIVTLENAVKAERKGRAECAVDLAIHKGRLTIAEREAQILTLANAKNDAEFATAVTALLAKGKVVKLAGGSDTQVGKALANADAPSARDQYCDAIKAHMAANPDDGIMTAHKAVKTKFPALFDKMNEEKSS